MQFAIGDGPPQFCGQAGSLCNPPVTRIQGTVATDQSFLDCALRLIGGRIPHAVIVHRGQAIAVDVIAGAVPHNRINLVQLVRIRPRTVVVLPFNCAQQVPVTEPHRPTTEQPLITQCTLGV